MQRTISIVFQGQGYTRDDQGGWINEANVYAPRGSWTALDRVAREAGFQLRVPRAPDPRGLRLAEAERYLLTRAGENRFHFRGLSATTAKGAYGYCCRCGQGPEAEAKLYVFEDKQNGELLEYGADCWKGPLRGGKPLLEQLRLAAAAEADPRRKALMGQNLKLFASYDAAAHVCSRPDEYWDPGQPPGPEGYRPTAELLGDQPRLAEVAGRRKPAKVKKA